MPSTLKPGDWFTVSAPHLSSEVDKKFVTDFGRGPFCVHDVDRDNDVWIQSPRRFFFTYEDISPCAAPGTDSNTLTAALACLRDQEKKGLGKYGTTLDTAGLSTLEIARHYQQEAADALMYATALVKALEEQEGQK